MFYRWILTAILCLALDFSAYAEKISVEQLKTIQKDLKGFDSLKVNFNQTVYTTIRKRKRPFSGTAYFGKPDKFRWKQEAPFAKEIIFGGKELVIYMKDEKLASKFGSLGNHVKEYQKLSSLVLDMNSLLQQYDLVLADHDKAKKLVSLELKPKDHRIDIDSVKLTVDLSQNFVNFVLLNYRGGNWMEFQFSNPSKVALKPAEFVFEKPRDVKLEVFP